ncbi:hypothetical protein M404DRAFT_245935 [Pisolithus tinctorius Marx 270]|uniref:Uncharacterized protein n=1 Tax=Pisolithus tinctorius Marx 270 TaxID=870435 RepID=A0A0C3IHG0_PISTI|nr:hypothetical protein M404DRAFT_245935 [Pisolithus tinctorius Marx 270]
MLRFRIKRKGKKKNFNNGGGVVHQEANGGLSFSLQLCYPTQFRIDDGDDSAEIGGRSNGHSVHRPIHLFQGEEA